MSNLTLSMLFAVTGILVSAFISHHEPMNISTKNRLFIGAIMATIVFSFLTLTASKGI